MFEATTHDIKVTVEPAYDTRRSRPTTSEYLFSYKITIENKGTSTCQLVSREWHIMDSTGAHRVVQGEGVIGQKPILHPNEMHVYGSWCPLRTPLGFMYGFFRMIRLEDNQEFFVQVPRFDFVASIINN